LTVKVSYLVKDTIRTGELQIVLAFLQLDYNWRLLKLTAELLSFFEELHDLCDNTKKLSLDGRAYVRRTSRHLVGLYLVWVSR
jgi:hypothetical protein